jgi:hypothetical protein
MSDFNDPAPIATPEQYRAALLAIRQRMTEGQLKMLQAHCRSEGHSASTDRLAEACDMPTAFSARYIAFAQWIATELKYAPKVGANKKMWLHALAYGRPDSKKTMNGQYELIMRPELVETLQAMKWA